MRIGYYPGCSLEGSSKEYNDSLFAVAEKCGVTLEVIKDWSCCGASAAHNLNHDLALALPARTLALAEKQGLEEIVVPCAACYSRIAGTKNEISSNVAVKAKIEGFIDLKLSADVKILTVFEFLNINISRYPGNNALQYHPVHAVVINDKEFFHKAYLIYILNVVPAFTLLSTSMVPPIASTWYFVINSPIPLASSLP